MRRALQVSWLLVVALAALAEGHNRTMDVTVLVQPPFTIYDHTKSGNDRFSGFLVDLFMEVSSNLQTNVTFSLFEGHGSNEALGLLTRKPVVVDMLLGPIMITKERVQLVDFTVPYISMPLNVITRTREAQKQLFGFFHPFHWQVWLLLLVMLCAYGIFMYVVESSANPQEFPPRGPKAWKESLWHTFMVSMQDRDKQISSSAGKMATTVYTFVIMIMLSAYTANLAATMSSEHIPEVVKGAAALKTKVVATDCGGAVERFLTEQELAGRVLCKTSQMSAAKAVQEREADAAIMNKLQAAFYASRACEIHVVPGIQLDNKPFAFPVQKGWIGDYANFNRWLVELVMDGTVDRLVAKWFAAKRSCRDHANKAMDYDNFYGLAIVLAVAIVVSALSYLLIKSYQNNKLKQTKQQFEKEGILPEQRISDPGPDPSINAAYHPAPTDVNVADPGESAAGITNPPPSAGE